MYGNSVELRANRLLRSFLTSRQRQNWDQKGWFEVEGSAGGRYRLCSGQQHPCTVQKLGPFGLRSASRCFESRERLPKADLILAAKIWLEDNEKGFMRMIRPYHLHAFL